MTEINHVVENERFEEETLTQTALATNEKDVPGATTANGGDLPPFATNSSFSVDRLEQDLQTLHNKWRVVEREMANRDEQLQSLRNEFDTLGATHEKLLKQKQALEDELSTHQTSAESDHRRVTELETTNARLRQQVQELQDYIDGRKADWDKLQAQARDYEDTIRGISDEMESQEKVCASKEEEKAAIAAELLDVQQELAELAGRHSEREASRVELQQALQDQSRELGILNGKTISLHKQIEKLEKKLERRENKLKSLRTEIGDLKRDNAEIEAMLRNEKTAAAEYQRRHEARIAELEDALSGREALEQQLRSDSSDAADTVETLRERLSEYEIRVAEQEAMFLESESERKSAEAELEAQRELVHNLERELGGRTPDIRLLDESADRLSAIHDGIRDLDLRIDSHWADAPERLPAEIEEVFESPDEIMLTPEELFDDLEDVVEHFIVTDDDALGEQRRYPLADGEFIVGRSRNSDIRINSKFISRKHVRIVVDGHRAVIEDAGSTNGLSVNNRPVSRHELVDGDALELGRSHFRYVHSSA